jgi:hypothetical protein
MAHTSTVQVLKVLVEKREKKAVKGEFYDVREAEVILLDDEGGIECAGRLPLSLTLSEGLKPGTYRAGFSMVRSSFGDRRGDIISQLVSLTPVPVRQSAAAAAK